ncbi:MAG: hypothetical protein WAX66_03350 [Patescibacteria group bacterium]
MPKFIKFIGVLTIFLWSLFITLVLTTLPNSYTNIFMFLAVLFLCLGFTLSLPFYFIYIKKYPNFINLKLLYRKGLKWGMFVSFGITGLLFLKALNLINLLNTGLLGLLWIGIFFQIKGKR